MSNFKKAMIALAVLATIATGFTMLVLLIRYGDSIINETNKKSTPKEPVAVIESYEDKSHINDFIEVDAEVTSVEGEFILILDNNIICEFCPCQDITDIVVGDSIKVTGTNVACGKFMYLDDCKLVTKTRVDV